MCFVWSPTSTVRTVSCSIEARLSHLSWPIGLAPVTADLKRVWTWWGDGGLAAVPFVFWEIISTGCFSVFWLFFGLLVVVESLGHWPGAEARHGAGRPLVCPCAAPGEKPCSDEWDSRLSRNGIRLIKWCSDSYISLSKTGRQREICYVVQERLSPGGSRRETSAARKFAPISNADVHRRCQFFHETEWYPVSGASPVVGRAPSSCHGVRSWFSAILKWMDNPPPCTRASISISTMTRGPVAHYNRTLRCQDSLATPWWTRAFATRLPNRQLPLVHAARPVWVRS